MSKRDTPSKRKREAGRGDTLLITLISFLEEKKNFGISLCSGSGREGEGEKSLSTATKKSYEYFRGQKIESLLLPPFFAGGRGGGKRSKTGGGEIPFPGELSFSIFLWPRKTLR